MEKPLVLLADDNDATCTLITAVLHRDFVVEVAHDGHEAIEKLKRRQYAAILLDLLMPVADGYTVLDHLQSESPSTLSRVIVVTASLAPREMDRVYGYAIRGVIRKPFEVDLLQAAVRECAGLGGESSLRGPLLAGGMLLVLAAADLLRKM
ncbi:MAG TPA: response regulator [Thermoanaerobaculia bacterium]